MADPSTEALAKFAPSLLRAWQRRPEEPVGDWMAFLAWLHSRPRPVVPEGCQAAAVQWDWLRRAAAHEYALADANDPARMSQDVAMYAMTILHRELEYQCGESLRDPGRLPKPELIQLLRMWAEFRSQAPRRTERGQTWVNLDKLTKEEAVQFAYLSAKAWQAEDE